MTQELTCPNCDSPTVVFHKATNDRAVVRCGGCGTLLATRDQFRQLLEREEAMDERSWHFAGVRQAGVMPLALQSSS
jgi:transcription elongation factor Elf1